MNRSVRVQIVLGHIPVANRKSLLVLIVLDGNYCRSKAGSGKNFIKRFGCSVFVHSQRIGESQLETMVALGVIVIDQVNRKRATKFARFNGDFAGTAGTDGSEIAPANGRIVHGIVVNGDIPIGRGVQSNRVCQYARMMILPDLGCGK